MLTIFFFPVFWRKRVSRLVPGVTLVGFAFCVLLLTLAAEVRPGERWRPAIFEWCTGCTRTSLRFTHSQRWFFFNPHAILSSASPFLFSSSICHSVFSSSHSSPSTSLHFCFLLSLSLSPASAPSLSHPPCFHPMSLSYSLSALLRSLIRFLAFSLRCLYGQWNNSLATVSSVLYRLLLLLFTYLFYSSVLSRHHLYSLASFYPLPFLVSSCFLRFYPWVVCDMPDPGHWLASFIRMDHSYSIRC